MHVKSGKQTRLKRNVKKIQTTQWLEHTYVPVATYLGKKTTCCPSNSLAYTRQTISFNYMYLMVNGQSACHVSNAQEYIHSTLPKVASTMVKAQHASSCFVYCATRGAAGGRRWRLVYMAAQHATTLLMQMFGHKCCWSITNTTLETLYALNVS